MKLPISRDEAWELVLEHNQEQVNLNHFLETEAVMRELAKRLQADPEEWGLIGLLHDLDWEETQTDSARHTLRTCEILSAKGFPEDVLYTIKAHNNEYLKEDFSPKSKRDYALRCGETITGLIYAVALVRPSKKVADVKVKSIKKKFKDKSFAANCRREVISECEKLGLTLEEFMELSLAAFQPIAGEIGL
jgi:uncharacterized protein